LRYYLNLPKILVFLAGCGAFVAAGVWMLVRPGSGAPDLLIAIPTMAFFGLGCVVFLVLLGVAVIARKPLLLLTPNGVSQPFPLGRYRVPLVPWEDFASISVLRQALRYSQYYLAFTAREPRQRAREFGALSARVYEAALSLYPRKSAVCCSLQLSFAFFRVTPATCQRVLHDIGTVFAPEIERYGIIVQDQIESL
jgi:hypothetical protein